MTFPASAPFRQAIPPGATNCLGDASRCPTIVRHRTSSYREAAFLQARLRNSANITLLRGPTLDGSFLGNIALPRCSAGQPFSLNLGVDPAVHVGYQKPTVHHRQSGIFQKEGSGAYTRAVTVTNTKNNAAVEGIALDQVPVSEDERLKVEICQPKGLRVEG